ncbi:MAG: methylenetetrahydrofolate reductase [Pseudomonadota bacterium]
MTMLSQKVWTANRQAAPIEVSFEFFPPASEKAVDRLLGTAAELEPFAPRFLSVTCGAGGTDDLATDRSFQAIQLLQRKVGTGLAAHLTCVGRSRREIDQRVREYAAAGIRKIVALRGDPPAGGQFVPHPGGYESAADLVAGIRKICDLDISVAAYPEQHPDSPSAAADIYNLKQKLNAGANRAITQFFFDNEAFIRFVAQARAAGIDQPIIPGSLLIDDFFKARGFAQRCGTHVPDWLEARFAGRENDPETHRLVAVSVAVEQVLALAAEGVRKFHFFTLNKSDLAVAVCRSLGLAPENETKIAA